MSDLDLLRRLGDEIVPPPLNALRETARRRTRRTAAVASLGAAAAVAIVLLGVHVVATSDHSAPPPVNQPKTRPLTYAEAATVHYGEAEVTLSSRVLELDLTDDGVVARTADGAIWFTDGSEPSQIGSLGTPGAAAADFGKPPAAVVAFGPTAGYMVSGNVGSLVAWWEFRRPDQPEVVVYDTAARQEKLRKPIEREGGSTVLLDSVTDRYVYWHVDPVAYELDDPTAGIELATGEQTTVTSKQYQADGPPPGTARTLLTSSADDGSGPFEVAQGLIQLAQNGRRLTPVGPGSFQVLDGATGTPVTFVAPAGFTPQKNAPGWLLQWVDDDTVIVAFRLGGPADLLTCDLTTHACEVSGQSLDVVLPEIS